MALLLGINMSNITGILEAAFSVERGSAWVGIVAWRRPGEWRWRWRLAARHGSITSFGIALGERRKFDMYYVY